MFEVVDAALDVGVTPTEFWEEKNEIDRAFILARRRALGTMKEWENHLHQKDLDRARRKKR